MNTKSLLETVTWLERNADTTKFEPDSKYIHSMNMVDAEITLHVADMMDLRARVYDNWRKSANL